VGFLSDFGLGCQNYDNPDSPSRQLLPGARRGRCSSPGQGWKRCGNPNTSLR
jgi:hypothetical protein